MLIFNPFITFGRGPIGPRQILDSYPGADGLLVETETGESYEYEAAYEGDIVRETNRLHNSTTSFARVQLSMDALPIERDIEFDYHVTEVGTGTRFIIYLTDGTSGGNLFIRTSHPDTSNARYELRQAASIASSVVSSPYPRDGRHKVKIRRNADNAQRVDVEWYVGDTLVLSGTSIENLPDSDHDQIWLGSYTNGDILDNLVITDRSGDE